MKPEPNPDAAKTDKTEGDKGGCPVAPCSACGQITERQNMYPRTKYEMTPADLEKILAAEKNL